jgi:hypothetical protein
MAYFANGDIGMKFEEECCYKCIHGEDLCPVMEIHLLHNYDHVNDKAHPVRKILNFLIPQNEDGFPGKCSMFIKSKKKND